MPVRSATGCAPGQVSPPSIIMNLTPLLPDQLGRPGARLCRIKFVVMADKLNLMFLAADINSTGRIDPFGPDFAAQQSRFAPRGHRSGRGRSRAAGWTQSGELNRQFNKIR